MSHSKHDLHDSSSPPTAKELLLEAVIQDIQDDGSAAYEAAKSLVIQDEQIKLAFRMKLVGALSGAGTAFEGTSDAVLGAYVKKHFINSIKGEL